MGNIQRLMKEWALEGSFKAQFEEIASLAAGIQTQLAKGHSTINEFTVTQGRPEVHIKEVQRVSSTTRDGAFIGPNLNVLSQKALSDFFVDKIFTLFDTQLPKEEHERKKLKKQLSDQFKDIQSKKSSLHLCSFLSDFTLQIHAQFQKKASDIELVLKSLEDNENQGQNILELQASIASFLERAKKDFDSQAGRREARNNAVNVLRKILKELSEMDFNTFKRTISKHKISEILKRAFENFQKHNPGEPIDMNPESIMLSENYNEIVKDGRLTDNTFKAILRLENSFRRAVRTQEKLENTLLALIRDLSPVELKKLDLENEPYYMKMQTRILSSGTTSEESPIHTVFTRNRAIADDHIFSLIGSFLDPQKSNKPEKKGPRT